MPTTRQIEPHFRTISGMDSTTPPHLVDESKWSMSRGMRSYYNRVQQFPLDFNLSVFDAAASTISDIINLPVGVRTESYILFLTNFRIYSKTSTANYIIPLLTGGPFAPSQDPGDTNGPIRLVGTVYNNQAWITGPTTKLVSTEGAVVRRYGIIPVAGTISAVLPVITTITNTSIANFNTIQGFPGGVGSPQPGITIRLPSGIAANSLQIGQRVQVVCPSQPLYQKEYSVASLDIIGGLLFGCSFLCVNGETVPSIGITPVSDMTVRSVGTSSTVGSVIIATYQASTDVRVLPGYKVRVSGFQNQQYNGIFDVLDVTGKNKFTFKLRGNPGVANDPLTGSFTVEGTSDVPSARYVENFFDHIVMANCTFKGVFEPYHLRWSDLFRPDVWEPTPENEADFYECSSWQRKNSVMAGCTGLGKIRDDLFTYTDSCILRTRYVGLPKVMVTEPAWEDFGNTFYNGLVRARNAHFFFDGYHQNFFMFDGQNPPKAIGDPILGFFLDNISLNFISTDSTQELVGFARQDQSEAWWSFFATTLGAVVAIVYNWGSNEWTIKRYSGGSALQCAGGGGTYTTLFDNIAGDFSNALQINESSKTDVRIPWFTSQGGALSREEESADATISLSQGENPFLETRDYCTDLQRVLEVDRITLHCDYVESPGIRVYVSARKSLQDPVVYKSVGLWTKNTIDGTITFQPIPGRVFRYKFEGTSTSFAKTRGWVFYNFTDNVFNILAER